MWDTHTTEGHSAAERRKYWYVLQNRWTSKTPPEVEGTRYKGTWTARFHPCEMSRMCKSLEIESRLIVAGGWRKRAMQSDGKVCRRLLLAVMKMFRDCIDVIVAEHWEQTKCRWIVHSKMFTFMLYEEKENPTCGSFKCELWESD